MSPDWQTPWPALWPYMTLLSPCSWGKAHPNLSWDTEPHWLSTQMKQPHAGSLLSCRWPGLEQGFLPHTQGGPLQGCEVVVIPLPFLSYLPTNTLELTVNDRNRRTPPSGLRGVASITEEGTRDQLPHEFPVSAPSPSTSSCPPSWSPGNGSLVTCPQHEGPSLNMASRSRHSALPGLRRCCRLPAQMRRQAS